MNMVYVLYEERESSQLCGVRGVYHECVHAYRI